MNIAVFCGSSTPADNHIIETAKYLGQRMAIDGHTLIYGGSNLGLMGIVATAALENGGKVIGVIPTIFSDKVINSLKVTELICCTTMAERKEIIIRRSDGFIALPGGIGTLDEVTEVLATNQICQLDMPMGLLNLNHFYDPFLNQVARMKEEGLLRPNATKTLLDAPDIDSLLEKVISY